MAELALVAVYQTASQGSKLEEASVSALNALLTKDDTLPFLISSLVGFLANSGSSKEDMRASAAALGIINQRIYHPDENTRKAILSVLPQLTELLKSEDSELVCSVARVLGGFGEGTVPEHRMVVALSGALPTLASIYQVHNHTLFMTTCAHCCPRVLRWRVISRLPPCPPSTN